MLQRIGNVGRLALSLLAIGAVLAVLFWIGWQFRVVFPPMVFAGAIVFLLTADISGAVNLTAPAPVTNAEFTKVLASTLSRPALVPVPSFGPKLLLGGELADALLFTGQRVLPERLTDAGYSFEHPTLSEALGTLLQR